MTVEEYYAAVRALGLMPSKSVPGVWCDAEGSPHHVPDPSKIAFEDRPKLIAKIKAAVALP